MTAAQTSPGSHDDRIGRFGRRLLAESVWRIVWRTAREGSRTAKWSLAVELVAQVCWFPFFAQLLHRRFPEVADPAVAISMLVFIGCAVLGAVSGLLHVAAVQDARSETRLPPDVVRAIPLLSFIAAVPLAFGLAGSVAGTLATTHDG